MNKTKSNNSQEKPLKCQNSQEPSSLSRGISKDNPDNTQMKTNQRIEELKKEIERIEILRKDMSSECWVSSQIRENLIEKEAKLEATTQTLKEVEEVIDKFFDEKLKQVKTHIEQFGKENNRDIDEREKTTMLCMPIAYKKELKKELGMEEKDENYK